MKAIILVLTFAALCTFSFAQADPVSRSWNQPVEPFRVIGNIYYVGANEITSFLITTPKGHVLLDGGFVETAPQIRDNIRKLGFEVEDVKYLILSQAHFDHAAGLAQLKSWTGASFVVSEADNVLTSQGGKDDFAWGDKYQFPVIKGDRLIKDGGTVELGGVTITAHITPGHTKGCTTWTMQAEEEGKRHDVVFVCSTSAPGYKLVNNPKYPTIVDDYRKTFEVLKGLSCDVLLGAHGSFFNLDEKRKLLDRNPRQNPFVDPEGCRRYLRDSQASFDQALKRQQ